MCDCDELRDLLRILYVDGQAHEHVTRDIHERVYRALNQAGSRGGSLGGLCGADRPRSAGCSGVGPQLSICHGCQR